MKVLTLNTYAGSLILGAQALGTEILGSYEDVGYGSAIPKANFPGLVQVNSWRQWPDQDLTDVVILAHPPCSAFSQQNVSPTKRGINTDAFECTRKVLRYAMSNNAAAIAIESVPGALAGAWETYNNFGERGGYHVYRILKNSICFGVPQYRDRFWAVLVRKTFAPDMTWTLAPRFTTIGTTVNHLLPGTPMPRLQQAVDKFVTRVMAKTGLTKRQARAALNPKLTWRRTSYARELQRRHFPTLTHHQVCKDYVSAFSSGQPSILAPGSWAPVLLGSSLWMYHGKPLCEEGYKAIMGFPPHYIFPDGTLRNNFRSFLSKGVCPPVAMWVLDNILNHLGVPHQQSIFTLGDSGYSKTIAPGRIASFKPSRATLLKHYESMYSIGSPDSDDLVPLRNEEEDLEEIE